jgi:hypothetical protein
MQWGSSIVIDKLANMALCRCRLFWNAAGKRGEGKGEGEGNRAAALKLFAGRGYFSAHPDLTHRRLHSRFTHIYWLPVYFIQRLHGPCRESLGRAFMRRAFFVLCIFVPHSRCEAPCN